MPYEVERDVAVQAVLRASELCQAVRAALVTADTMAKKDKSPVTVADFGAQAIISHDLATAFPNDPLVGEEHAADLEGPDAAELRDRVVRSVQAVAPELTESTILRAISRGTHPGGAKGRHWCVDPIDGTKGFLRGEQYAVALALIEDGVPVLGVLGCPNLPADPRRPDSPAGCLFIAVRGQGAHVRPLRDAHELPVRVDDITEPAKAVFCESVESGHSAHDDSAAVARLLGVTRPPYRIDSQCKYAAVARGDASIYLRLPTRAGYEEKIWDHAAGWMVIREAGGQVSDITGKPLDFSIGRTLRDNRGVVATNGHIHDLVIEAVRRTLNV
ncbi:MAG TPA: 3'(2'),5'-bisphosphate nucleotidase [Phycisphaerae bacterium]|nr:3'(2'),5'-bisphosphate nucleotidase [Phycisphaerae bacterium]